MITEQNLDDAVREWINCRETWKAKSGEPNPGDIQRFIDDLNALSNKFVVIVERSNPEWLEALGELVMHAAAAARRPDVMK